MYGPWKIDPSEKNKSAMKMICLGEEQKVSFFFTQLRLRDRMQFVHTHPRLLLSSRTVCYRKKWLGQLSRSATERAPPF